MIYGSPCKQIHYTMSCSNNYYFIIIQRVLRTVFSYSNKNSSILITILKYYQEGCWHVWINLPYFVGLLNFVMQAIHKGKTKDKITRFWSPTLSGVAGLVGDAYLDWISFYYYDIKLVYFCMATSRRFLFWYSAIQWSFYFLFPGDT